MVPPPTHALPWREVEIELVAGSAHEAPYPSVEVWADFTCGSEVLRRPAFWDGGGVWRLGGAVAVEMAALVDQLLGAGVARQLAHQRHGRRDERTQRARLRPHLVRRCRAHHPREIRQDRRQIAPAQ